MTTENENRRHEFIDEMQRLYKQSPFSDQELADRLGTDRTNIFRIRKLMEEQMGIPIQPDMNKRGRYFIPKEYTISHIPLNRIEAAQLYLAGRRLQQQTRTSQRPVARALEKLALALNKPLAEQMVRAAEVVLAQEQDHQQEAIFATLVDCWLDGIPVRITHRKLHGEARTYRVHPYQLEPSVWGDGTYLIGHSEYHGKLATFKLARIEKVVKGTGSFAIPEGFDIHALLQHAWGIWHADAAPETVVLRFSAYVTPRVRETLWHPQQTIMVHDDGSSQWSASVAEPLEMLPWVRGWGMDCEIVQPTELREEVVTHVKGLIRKYQIPSVGKKMLYHLPYAKTDRKNPGRVHLLLFHLIDVGQVALTIWCEILTDSIRSRLAQILGLNVDDCGRFVAFLVALHDLGKAGPAYQRKYAPEWLQHELQEAGLVLTGVGDAYEKTFPHGTVSTWALKRLLPDFLGLDKRFAGKIAVALGGHHGAWPSPTADEHLSDSKHPQWEELRQELFWEVKSVFAPLTNVKSPDSVQDSNTFLTILSGLTSVADWIGSRNDECFGYIENPLSTRQYAQQAKVSARAGLEDLGWMGWKPTGRTRSFGETFAHLQIESPRPLQQKVIDLAADEIEPTLLILEAPTGIGKTEIALYITERWLQQTAGRGLYVAMPTQATSNQMYARVREFLHQLYPDMPINFHLVHGQAAWLDDLKKEVELQGVGDDRETGVAAESWFNPRKRTLLAPFGVGTVDQALMSILQTKHFFVRIFGLSHKVVIFDEVHAYDTYMNTLFHRLLAWLNAIGTSVVVLSATLPNQTRRALVKAYTGKELPEQAAVYPSLTLANSQRQVTVTLPKPESHTLEIEWRAEREPTALVGYLQRALAHGGCAAILCNTVGRAQAIFQALTDARSAGLLDVNEENLILFHSRFPPVWRMEIESRVRAKFEKGGERPQRAIVVATQVIEQSLDIDFDLMLSDLAPVDLILQRAGRLHRHRANDSRRYGLPRRLVLFTPEKDENGVPQFGSDTFIYAEYVLLRTYLKLRGASEITIPEDTSPLIEAVYDPRQPIDLPAGIDDERLRRLLQKLENEDRSAQAKAGRGLVAKPGERRLLSQEMLGLDEENPDVHETFRAQTRDIDFSVTVVCLHQDAAGLYVYGQEGQIVRIDLDKTPSPPETKLLLQNAIAIQDKWLGSVFVAQPTPPGWRENGALRYCRHAIFSNGICDLPQHTLKLSQAFGLQTTKKEKV